jgi:DNA polymerase-1
MQNLPRVTVDAIKSGIVIKNQFVCSDPENYVIVEVDYAQAELRLIAEYSRDEKLYGAIVAGRDPHAELAVRLYHKDLILDMEAGKIDARKMVTKEERDKGKTANFSLTYGKQVEGFAAENDIPLDEAAYIINTFWNTYVGVARWRDKTLDEAHRTLYFTTYFGRKRRLAKLSSQDQYSRAEAEREGINFCIQSPASDYNLLSAMKTCDIADLKGYDYKTLSFVHDATVYEINKKNLQEFLTLIEYSVHSSPGLTIPMECEIKVGYRLGDLKEWKTNSNGIWEEVKKST